MSALYLKNVRLAWVEGTPVSDVGVGNDGRILFVGRPAVLPWDAIPETVDGGGEALLFPGLIDTHVHFREPGMEHKATIASESRALLCSGITSFLDMPNTVPVTTGLPELTEKMRRAAISSAINYGFFIAATDGTVLKLTPGARIYAGVKLFLGATTGSTPAPRGKDLEYLFEACADYDIPIMVHAEDNATIAANTTAAIARYGSREDIPLEAHSEIRSARACYAAAAQAVDLANRFGTRLHLAHVSTAAEVNNLLEKGDAASKLITAETTPLYLDPDLADPSCRSWRHKVNPALKERRDREAILEGLLDGRIDTIASDHAPHLAAEKKGGALTAASGAPGGTFALVRMLQYLSPEIICRKMAANPAAIFGIDGRGTLKPGAVADMVLVRPSGPFDIVDSMTPSTCGWTPYAGLGASHHIERVWLGGRTAFEKGKYTGAAPSPLIFRN